MMVAGKGFSLNRIKPKFAACPVRGMSRELLFLQSSPPTWTAQFAKAKRAHVTRGASRRRETATAAAEAAGAGACGGRSPEPGTAGSFETRSGGTSCKEPVGKSPML
ncbi:hypothetical protein PVAP13_7NG249434 [Panicum virgatum]|uniref:Uncharacterized protein n=1 Tax=Panicum virgatum TaxID=38727 RepID=A0A8T0PYI3_PANVG|nr:hypothetical protein PVAP13_7NG249434 [Panicum virgatum]